MITMSDPVAVLSLRSEADPDSPNAIEFGIDQFMSLHLETDSHSLWVTIAEDGIVHMCFDEIAMLDRDHPADEYLREVFFWEGDNEDAWDECASFLERRYTNTAAVINLDLQKRLTDCLSEIRSIVTQCKSHETTADATKAKQIEDTRNRSDLTQPRQQAIYNFYRKQSLQLVPTDRRS